MSPQLDAEWVSWPLPSCSPQAWLHHQRLITWTTKVKKTFCRLLLSSPDYLWKVAWGFKTVPLPLGDQGDCSEIRPCVWSP